MGTEEKKGQRLEAAQMKFIRHLFGITNLDKEKNQCMSEKAGAPTEKVATTRTEDEYE